jgi:hypothetical protein
VEIVWRGRVEEYLKVKARRGEKAVFILVDPDPVKHVINGIEEIPRLIRGWGYRCYTSWGEPWYI